MRKSDLVIRLFLFVVSSAWRIDAQERPTETPPRDSDVLSPVPQSLDGGRIQEHRLGDKENRWLFAGIGAARALDYSSTLNMRRRGRQEILLSNDVVDNHTAFAIVEAAGAGTSLGASYLFHRYGHHKLERWISFLHIGVTTVGAVRNYCLKTAHRAAP